MALTNEEKIVIQEALQVYVQVAMQQMPKQHVQQLAKLAEGILRKLDTVGKEPGKGNRPAGISEEWYNNVCATCDKLTASGCSDKVTEKYPGKCDPILHYENRKAGRE